MGLEDLLKLQDITRNELYAVTNLFRTKGMGIKDHKGFVDDFLLDHDIIALAKGWFPTGDCGGVKEVNSGLNITFNPEYSNTLCALATHIREYTDNSTKSIMDVMRTKRYGRVFFNLCRAAEGAHARVVIDPTTPAEIRVTMVQAMCVSGIDERLIDVFCTLAKTIVTTANKRATRSKPFISVLRLVVSEVSSSVNTVSILNKACEQLKLSQVLSQEQVNRALGHFVQMYSAILPYREG